MKKVPKASRFHFHYLLVYLTHASLFTLLATHNYGNHIKVEEMGGSSGRLGEENNAYIVLVGKLEERDYF